MVKMALSASMAWDVSQCLLFFLIEKNEKCVYLDPAANILSNRGAESSGLAEEAFDEISFSSR